MSHILIQHLTVKEYADKKGISRQSVYRAIKDKRIVPILVGQCKMNFISPDLLNIEFKGTSLKERVVIESFGKKSYSLVNEAGQSIESDFKTYEEAETFATNNEMEVVSTFFIK